MLLIVGLVAPEPCPRNRSDQLPQGSTGYRMRRGGAFLVLDAAGGDSRDPERPDPTRLDR